MNFYQELKLKDLNNLVNFNVPVIEKEEPKYYEEIIDVVDLNLNILKQVDDKFIFLYTNPNFWKNLLGYPISTEKLRGKSYFDTFPFISQMKCEEVFYYAQKHPDNIIKGNSQFYDENGNLLIYCEQLIVFKNNRFYNWSENSTKYHLEKIEKEKLFDNSSIGIIQMNSKGQITKINKKMQEMVEYDLDELNQIGIGKLILESVHFNSSITNFMDVIKKVLTGEVHFNNSQLKFQSKSGKLFWVSTYTIKDTSNTIQVSCNDITELKRVEEARLELSENLEKVQDISKIAIGSWDPVNKFQWTNEIYNIIDEKPGNVSFEQDVLFELVQSTEKEYLTQKMLKAIENESLYEQTLKIKTKIGNVKYVYVTVNFMKDENGNLRSASLVQDVTEKVLREKELEQVSNERQILLQEVHHRVKNNLQIILSLLNLELRYHPDNPENTIQQTRNRINSMALIHEEAYKSYDVSKIDSKQYITKQMDNLFKLYSKNNIETHYDIDDVDVHTEKFIPLGLILNELGLNTIKYAFPNNQPGNFYLKFKVENDEVLLTVYDDGIGLPDDFDIYNSTSLGFTIINTLTSQIEGELNILELDKGFGVSIRFKY
jgi:PAS domain S-box-containing protein